MDPEATAKWGRQELVREIVRAIRHVHPPIVIAAYGCCEGEDFTVP